MELYLYSPIRLHSFVVTRVMDTLVAWCLVEARGYRYLLPLPYLFWWLRAINSLRNGDGRLCFFKELAASLLREVEVISSCSLLTLLGNKEPSLNFSLLRTWPPWTKAFLLWILTNIPAQNDSFRHADQSCLSL